MELKDLKVESANVFVTNANQKDAKYSISAHFSTIAGKLRRIDNGTVKDRETEKIVATFYKDVEYDRSYHVGFSNEAYEDESLQCEVNSFILQYIQLGESKSVQETEE